MKQYYKITALFFKTIVTKQTIKKTSVTSQAPLLNGIGVSAF